MGQPNREDTASYISKRILKQGKDPERRSQRAHTENIVGVQDLSGFTSTSSFDEAVAALWNGWNKCPDCK